MSDSKLDLILEKLQVLDGKVDLLDGRFTALDGKVDGLDGRFMTLEGKVVGLDSDMKKVHTRLDSHENLLIQLIGIVKSTNEKVVSIAERQEAHEREFSARLDEQAYTIEVLNRDQLKCKGDIEMLKNR